MLNVNLRDAALRDYSQKREGKTSLLSEFLLGLAFMAFCAGITYILIYAERRSPMSPANLRREVDDLQERVERLERR